MPFVDFNLSPERIIHLNDQRKMAEQDWKEVRPDGDLDETTLTEEQRKALECLRSLNRQLRGQPA